VSKQTEEVRAKAVQGQVDLYKQLRDQLLIEVERYRENGEDDLARIILDSLE
jgi:hypothetical protein